MGDFRAEIATPAQKEAYIRTYMNVGYQVPKSSQIYRTASRELQRLAKGEIKTPKKDTYRAVKETAQVKADAQAAKVKQPPQNVSRKTPTPPKPGRDVVPGDILEFTGMLWFSNTSRVRQIMVTVKINPRSYGIAPESFSTYEQYLFEVWAKTYFGNASDQVHPDIDVEDDEAWDDVHIRLL